METHRLLFFASAILAAGAARAAEPDIIRPGDARIQSPAFEDFEAIYTSRFSKTGKFRLQVRNMADGAKIHAVDIIPGPDAVVVSQRVIDAASQKVEFRATPYFAWGPEFIVQRQYAGDAFHLTRVPIAPGEPISLNGEFEYGGAMSETFSPTLASLMPMESGAEFQLPVSVSYQDGEMANRLAQFKVIGRERIDTPSGRSCDCWVIESTNGPSVDRNWVAREAPFVFRWHRDIGGETEFAVELEGFTLITE